MLTRLHGMARRAPHPRKRQTLQNGASAGGASSAKPPTDASKDAFVRSDASPGEAAVPDKAKLTALPPELLSEVVQNTLLGDQLALQLTSKGLNASTKVRNQAPLLVARHLGKMGTSTPPWKFAFAGAALKLLPNTLYSRTEDEEVLNAAWKNGVGLTAWGIDSQLPVESQRQWHACIEQAIAGLAPYLPQQQVDVEWQAACDTLNAEPAQALEGDDLLEREKARARALMLLTMLVPRASDQQCAEAMKAWCKVPHGMFYDSDPWTYKFLGALKKAKTGAKFRNAMDDALRAQRQRFPSGDASAVEQRRLATLIEAAPPSAEALKDAFSTLISHNAFPTTIAHFVETLSPARVEETLLQLQKAAAAKGPLQRTMRALQCLADLWPKLGEDPMAKNPMVKGVADDLLASLVMHLRNGEPLADLLQGFTTIGPLVGKEKVQKALSKAAQENKGRDKLEARWMEEQLSFGSSAGSQTTRRWGFGGLGRRKSETLSALAETHLTDTSREGKPIFPLMPSRMISNLATTFNSDQAKRAMKLLMDADSHLEAPGAARDYPDIDDLVPRLSPKDFREVYASAPSDIKFLLFAFVPPGLGAAHFSRDDLAEIDKLLASHAEEYPADVLFRVLERRAKVLSLRDLGSYIGTADEEVS